ncbi:MAG: hypothetical protein Q8K64_01210 [Sediminibacterium sp.]|nr:hypothetical protein [Sediminibacterium sp.]
MNKLNIVEFINLSNHDLLVINGGDTGYYGSSPSQMLGNMDKNGKAIYHAVSTTVHHVSDFFRGFWDGVVH